MDEVLKVSEAQEVKSSWNLHGLTHSDPGTVSTVSRWFLCLSLSTCHVPLCSSDSDWITSNRRQEVWVSQWKGGGHELRKMLDYHLPIMLCCLDSCTSEPPDADQLLICLHLLFLHLFFLYSPSLRGRKKRMWRKSEDRNKVKVTKVWGLLKMNQWEDSSIGREAKDKRESKRILK